MDAGTPLYQTLVQVGVNIDQFTVRTHTMAALYAVSGWEDPLSFQEWRLTGTYLFGFTSPIFFPAETGKERLCTCGKQLDEGGHHVQCCAIQARGAWLFGHHAVQAVWTQPGEEAGFIEWVDVVHGLPREF